MPVDRSSQQYNEILAAADAACFVAKEHGRNRIHVSDTDDREVAARYHETQWVHRLNQAIDRDLFVLFGQRIIPLRRGDPTLSRSSFACSEGGEIISPSRFIPAAERYRMMPKLDRWVIRKAFAIMRILIRNHRGPAPNLINLSGQSLADLSVLDEILVRLDTDHIDPDACASR